MFRCARIQGLDTIEGLLLFGREHFYIVDGFTLLKSREIRDIASLPEGSHEPIVPSTSPRTSLEHHACSKFHYDEIREVHQRRLVGTARNALENEFFILLCITYFISIKCN